MQAAREKAEVERIRFKKEEAARILREASEIKYDANGIPFPPKRPPLPPLPYFNPADFVLEEKKVLKAPIPIRQKGEEVEGKKSMNTFFMEKNAEVLTAIKQAINFGCKDDDDSDEEDDDSSDSYSSASD